MNPPAQKLSTSALARQLEIPTATLFATLSDAGWISRSDDTWRLTGKGEYEGGEYRDSQRFGRYIVWPVSVADHSLIQGMERSAQLTAVELGRSAGLQGQTINRLLHELGLLRRSYHGWQLTDVGRAKGGEQMENPATGMHYAQWPPVLRDDPVFRRQVADFKASLQADSGEEDDLFSDNTEHGGIDGHVHKSQGLAMICNWLYLAGVVHACRRRLPLEEELHADLFLPGHPVYIEYWGGDDSPTELKARMARDEWYRDNKVAHIEVRSDDLPHLNDVMSQQLLRLGVDFH